ncbi:MAG TPA: aminopeptidase P family protein [Pyrinomonadaceae bacterium]|nr:aminopeptidase P family protein [Pyrinomonadaceae bacterium]HMP66751.1 aminopeptidase P family protein [Pyrinomonadaceae bacterium]
MKKVVIWVIIVAFVLSGLAAAVFSQPAAETSARAIRITPPAPVFSDAERQAELAKRRAAVADRMEDRSILILFSAEPKIYSNSVNYVYRQENNLVYLTGLKQQNATFVMTKNQGVVEEYLFLPARNPVYETWEGRMYSNEEASTISGLRNIIPIAERDAFIKAVTGKTSFSSSSTSASINTELDHIYLLVPEGPGDRNAMREFRQEHEFRNLLSGRSEKNARPIFAELRLIKSPYEIRLMQHAVDISIEAHMRSQAMVQRAKWEYEVQAEVEYTFRRRNADYWGYPSIVGCGPNATTLHYQLPKGQVRSGDLLLMDVGAEYEHYTADITRTFPVNGRFSKEQAEIYQIVYDAQDAVAKMTRPGVRFAALQLEANRVIEEGLFELGLITKKDGQQFRRWFMHGLGHWLGMNVHDVGDYSTPLAPGMVFTNEPGIYLRPDALEWLSDTPENREFKEKVGPVFERYKGIGVRIEDVMLVTPNGVEWMNRALPRSIADIETFMARAASEYPY